MGKKYDVIVIGTGIGGIGCAALLAHSGFKTLVLEKNKLLGGRCTSYKKEGFTVDMWVHFFNRCERGPFGEILRRIGMEDAVRFFHAPPEQPPIFRVGAMEIPLNRKAPRALLFSALPRKTFKMTGEKLEALDDVPLEEWIRRYTQDEFIINAIGVLCVLGLVVFPWEASTGEFIRCTRLEPSKEEVGLGYPYGGAIAIPRGFAKGVESYGGEIRMDSEVSKIIVRDSRVEGVELKGGSLFEAPVIVSNAGLRNTVLRLVGSDHFTKEYVDYINGLEVSEGGRDCGLVCIKLALNKPVTRHPMIFGSPSPEGLDIRFILDYILKDEIPPFASWLFLPVPSNIDPSLAPPGRQLIIAGSFVPVTTAHWEDWIKYCLDSVEEMIPGVREHLLWYDVAKTDDLRQWSGRIEADIVGIAQRVGQVGEKRPSFVSPIEGLYYVGADTGKNNIGTELAAESAISCAERIITTCSPR